MNNKFVWFNPYLPQTLQISVLLAYFSAAFSIIGLVIGPILPIAGAIFPTSTSPIEFLIMLAGVLGAFGISNLRWWGYIIAIIVAFIPFIIGFAAVALVTSYTLSDYFSDLVGPLLFGTIFNIAIIALLLHPLSHNFVKSHFEKSIP